MATTNSDGLGDARPGTKEDALGGDPKIVDYPANAEDITEDGIGDDDASDDSQ